MRHDSFKTDKFVNFPNFVAISIFIPFFPSVEAKIGLFTDVAGGYFLSRMKKNLGLYLGLTGQRITGKELVQVGLADYYVKNENLAALEKALLENGSSVNGLKDAQKIVEQFQEPVEEKYPLGSYVNKHFGKNSVQEILDSIQADKDNAELSEVLIKNMKTFSPISMRVIFEQIKRGKDLDLAENFKMDYRIAVR